MFLNFLGLGVVVVALGAVFLLGPKLVKEGIGLIFGLFAPKHQADTAVKVASPRAVGIILVTIGVLLIVAAFAYGWPPGSPRT